MNKYCVIHSKPPLLVNLHPNLPSKYRLHLVHECLIYYLASLFKKEDIEHRNNVSLNKIRTFTTKIKI